LRKREEDEGTSTSGNPFISTATGDDSDDYYAASDAHEVVGKITAYATQTLSAQYRTHAFTILVCNNLARLIRWDRAGAIVTEPIYYDKDSYLYDFLTCYNNASPKVRGHDTTVSIPTSEDIEAMMKSVREPPEGPHLSVTIPVQSRSKPRRYIISRPRARPYIPAGRWTRTSIAYDVERKKRVFLKDSWRVLVDGIRPEGDVYALLKEKNVPNVPFCSLANDIGDADVHRTQTDRFVGKFLEYDAPHFTAHRHYRLVLDDIGEKLETFRKSRDMVKAVRAAILGKCHWFRNVLRIADSYCSSPCCLQ
jgi:hypothetical protein